MKPERRRASAGIALRKKICNKAIFDLLSEGGHQVDMPSIGKPSAAKIPMNNKNYRINPNALSKTPLYFYEIIHLSEASHSRWQLPAAGRHGTTDEG
jgi:hypothetical protein